MANSGELEHEIAVLQAERDEERATLYGSLLLVVFGVLVYLQEWFGVLVQLTPIFVGSVGVILWLQRQAGINSKINARRKILRSQSTDYIE